MSFNISTSKKANCSSDEFLPKSENCLSDVCSALELPDNQAAGDSFDIRIAEKMLTYMNKEFDALEQLLKLRRTKLQYDIEQTFYMQQLGPKKKLEDQNSNESPVFLKYVSTFNDLQSQIENYGSFKIHRNANLQKRSSKEEYNIRLQNPTSMTRLNQKLENVTCSNDDSDWRDFLSYWNTKPCIVDENSQTDVPTISTEVQNSQTTEVFPNLEQSTETHIEDHEHLARSLSKAMVHLFTDEETPSKKLAAYMTKTFLSQNANACLDPDSGISGDKSKMRHKEQNDSISTGGTNPSYIFESEDSGSEDSSSDDSDSEDSFDFIDCGKKSVKDSKKQDEKCYESLPAFVIFTQTCFREEKERVSVGSTAFIDFIRVCVGKWEKMSEEEKEPYLQLSSLEHEGN